VGLRARIRACLNGDGDHTEEVVPPTNRRGRVITCRVTKWGKQRDSGGHLLMDEQATGSSQVH
jgi:hypothetical protein